MKKRFFAVVLCAVMVLALLPAAAFAVGPTVTIGGIELPSGSYYVNGTGGAVGTVSPTDPGAWNARYDGTTLYLNGLVLTNYAGGFGIKMDGGSLTLDLAGTNTVSLTGLAGVINPIALCFNNGGTLTVQGTGSLTASAQSATSGAIGAGIQGNLLLKSGTLTGEAAGMIDTNSSAPTGVGVDAGIGTITVEGGTLTGRPISGSNCFAGISCGTLNVSNGVVSGEGYQNGIGAINGMDISGGDVTGICKNSNYGLYAQSGPIEISGGSVRGACTGSNSYRGYGIRADPVQISGGDSLFTGNHEAVKGSIYFTGGQVLYAITASTELTDSPSDPYDQTKLSTYKSLHVTLNRAITLESPADTALTAYTFPNEMVGYATPPTMIVTVKNTGAINTGNLNVTISSTDFTASPTRINSISPGASADSTFTVAPIAGLTANTYNATVTVSNEYVTKSFTVQFIVDPLPTVATPTFSHAAGRYPSAQSVTLSCATAGADIYYTTDNTEPTEMSTLFNAGTPITVSTTTTVKAKAFMAGMTPSAVASAAYTIGAAAAPVLPTYTVYNDKSISEADVRLTGAGLDPSDMLIVERMKSGSLYDYMVSLAPSGTTLRVYDISLKSGSKGGYPMYLSFDLGAEYEGQIFTLIHRKADGSTESFTAMANPRGTVAFGPLSELSPFSIVRGSVEPLSVAAFVAAVPDTGDAPLLWPATVLVAGAAFVAVLGLCLRKRRDN